MLKLLPFELTYIHQEDQVLWKLRYVTFLAEAKDNKQKGQNATEWTEQYMYSTTWQGHHEPLC